jgi:hypothetical protein
MLKITALVPLALAFAVTPVAAQTFTDAQVDKPATAFLGGSFIVAQPQNEFADHINTSFGGSLNLVWSPAPVPAYLGLKFEAGLVGYGHERKRVPLSPTVGRVHVDVTTSNTITYLHVGPQLMLNAGILRPYISPSAGVTYMATTSSVAGDDSESFASDINFDDVNFSYGATGGLYIPLKRGGTPVLMDLGLRYHRNGEARYLIEGSIQDNPDGSITYEPIESRADLLTFQLGVSVGLGSRH